MESPPAEAPALLPLEREPCDHHNPLRNAFFGDLHVHTGYSVDAWVEGTLATPDEAYRFARGEEIRLPPNGTSGEGFRTVRLDRPLDFAAVTDHAEWLGELSLCTTSDSEVYDSRACRIFRGEQTSILARLIGLDGLAARMVGPVGFFGRGREVCGADARIIENPSCRWSTRQCLSLAPERRPAGCADARVPRVVQERAWTSPIWYSPGS